MHDFILGRRPFDWTINICWNSRFCLKQCFVFLFICFHIHCIGICSAFCRKYTSLRQRVFQSIKNKWFSCTPVDNTVDQVVIFKRSNTRLPGASDGCPCNRRFFLEIEELSRLRRRSDPGDGLKSQWPFCFRNYDWWHFAGVHGADAWREKWNFAKAEASRSKFAPNWMYKEMMNIDDRSTPRMHDCCGAGTTFRLFSQTDLHLVGCAVIKW